MHLIGCSVSAPDAVMFIICIEARIQAAQRYIGDGLPALCGAYVWLHVYP